MSLDIDVRVEARDVRATLSVERGEIVAIVGENGAGKSTILGCVAGTVTPDAGTVRLGRRTLFDGPRRDEQVYRRRVGLLAQTPLLFPHLSVAENVAFGPRARRERGASAAASAQEWLERVGAAHLAHAPATALSGGQAQRVAIARALAAEPDAVLLDEPFTALDVAARDELRAVVSAVVRPRPTLLVSHDLVDVTALADRIVVMADGRIVQQGSVEEVLTRPQTAFVARLVGRELLRGRADGPRVTLETGVTVSGRSGRRVSGAAAVLLDPERVNVRRGRHVGGVTGAVERVGAHGSALRIWVRGVCGEVSALEARGLVPGEVVTLDVPRDAVEIYASAPEDARATVS